MPRRTWKDELADESVSLLIDGKRWQHWDDLEVELSLDTFSTCGFSAPWDPDRADLREAFRPFKYKPLKALIDDETLFKGSLVGIDPESTVESTSFKVYGYSLPAVIHECTPPGNTTPHTYSKVTLRGLAEILLRPFGVAVDFRGNDYLFSKPLHVKQGTKIFDFLQEVAKQSGKVFTNTPDGQFLIWSPVKPGRPVATLDTTENPFEIKAKFKADGYFSEITGFNPASRKKAGLKWTEPNPFLLDVLRPDSFDLDNIEEGDVQAATKARLGRMFGNMASWTVEDLPTWRDPAGALWAPNTTVVVKAPRSMIYRQYELVIRSVKFRKSAGKFSSELELVLPGSFNGELPASLPWEEP